MTNPEERLVQFCFPDQQPQVQALANDVGVEILFVDDPLIARDIYMGEAFASGELKPGKMLGDTSRTEYEKGQKRHLYGRAALIMLKAGYIQTIATGPKDDLEQFYVRRLVL